MRILQKGFLGVVATACLSACGGGDIEPTLSAQEANLSRWLAGYQNDADFTLMLEAPSGKRYQYSKGNSSAETFYESASTAKLVTAVVILDLVEKAQLQLNDKPQDHLLSNWPSNGNLSNITLSQLLNFTSGLIEFPKEDCVATATFNNCIAAIKNDSKNGVVLPGKQFYYGAAHLQVAGAMAIAAANKTSWEALFNDFKIEHDVFPNSSYSSSSNPRLAGGMRWTATDYMDFLGKLATEKILSAETLTLLRTNNMGSVTIVKSPAAEMNKTWRYGYGVWLESCSNSSACVSKRVSSIGAYGAYPFIDFDNQYWGILAREKKPNTFANGYDQLEASRSMLESWGRLANQ